MKNKLVFLLAFMMVFSLANAQENVADSGLNGGGGFSISIGNRYNLVGESYLGEELVQGAFTGFGYFTYENFVFGGFGSCLIAATMAGEGGFYLGYNYFFPDKNYGIEVTSRTGFGGSNFNGTGFAYFCQGVNLDFMFKVSDFVCVALYVEEMFRGNITQGAFDLMRNFDTSVGVKLSFCKF